jgi:uncharacterized membrane protein (TIGR02234 family)
VSSGRRELVAVVGLTVLGSALTLLAVGRPWAHAVVSEAPLPSQVVDLSGRAVAPLTAALGIAALAAAVAVLATRGRWRVVVGIVIALAGAAIVGTSASLSATHVQTGSALRDRVPAASHRGAIVTVELRAWRHGAAAGGIVLVAAGLVTIARGRALATMGRRYDAPTETGSAAREVTSAAPLPQAQPARPAPTALADAADSALWEQLERGEDPTA